MATKTRSVWDRLRLLTLLLFLDTWTLTWTRDSAVWITNTEKEGTSALHLLRATTWWDAAGIGCGGGGSHLYLPGVDASREVTHLVQEDTPYWIGALENSRWMWTGDETPLYTVIGYSHVPPDPDTLIKGNSVFKCHVYCHQEDYTVFGLRGEECYCLASDSDIINNEEDFQRCNGSYEEFCGNDEWMSVYKSAVDNLVPDETGECAYAERRGNTIHIEQDDSCDTKRFLVCSKPVAEPKKCTASVCRQHKRRSWYESSQVCDLLKVTAGNGNQLRSIMAKSSNRRQITYWVGLERRHSWRWINGSDVEGDYDHHDDEEACLSLSVFRSAKSSPTVILSWRSCGENHDAICQKVLPYSTTVPSVPDSAQTTNLPGEGGSSNMTSPDQVADLSDSDNTGAYVGVTIVVLLIAVVCIVAVLFFKRKEKFCFARSKKEKSEFQTMSPNYDVSYYSTPESIKRNTRQAGRQLSTPDVYSRPDDHYYSEPSEVIPPIRTVNNEHIYVNDPHLSKLHSYNKLHDRPPRSSVDGYDHVELQSPTVELKKSKDELQRPTGEVQNPKDGTFNTLDDHLYLVLEDENGIPSGQSGTSLGYAKTTSEHSRAPSEHVLASPGHSKSPSGHAAGSSEYSESSEVDPVYQVTDSGEGDSAVMPQDYSLASQVQEPKERRAGYYSPLRFDESEENVYSHIDEEESESRRPYSLAAEHNRVDTHCNTDMEYLVPGEHEQSSIVDNVYSLAEDASSA